MNQITKLFQKAAIYISPPRKIVKKISKFYFDETENLICSEFPASSMDIDSVGFYGISTIVGYLMPNPLNTYTEYDLQTDFIHNIFK